MTEFEARRRLFSKGKPGKLRPQLSRLLNDFFFSHSIP